MPARKKTAQKSGVGKSAPSHDSGSHSDDSDDDNEKPFCPTNKDVKRLKDEDSFWQYTYLLHQLDSKKSGSSNYKALKETTLRDYDTWIVASALMGTAGLGTMFDLDINDDYKGSFGMGLYRFIWNLSCQIESGSTDPITHDATCNFSRTWLTREHLDFIALLGFIGCMTMNVYIGFTCFSHFVSTHGYYNMIPASQFVEARVHHRTSYEKYQNEHQSFTSTSSFLGYGAEAFFTSFNYLLFGISFGTWVKFGPIFSIVPLLVGANMIGHLKIIHKIKHWGEHALPAFAEKMKSKAEAEKMEIEVQGKADSPRRSPSQSKSKSGSRGRSRSKSKSSR